MSLPRVSSQRAELPRSPQQWIIHCGQGGCLEEGALALAPLLPLCREFLRISNWQRHRGWTPGCSPPLAAHPFCPRRPRVISRLS